MSELSFLNDSTMSQACALLLSDADYEESAANSECVASETSSQQKNSTTDKARLFNLYRRCQTATNIAAKRKQQQQISKLSGTGSNDGKNATGNVSKKSRLSKGPIPLRSTRSNKAIPFQHPSNRRSSSDESSSKSNVNGNNPLKKKKQPPSSDKKGNPPASALAFLAALNKQKIDNERDKRNQALAENDSKGESLSASTPPSSPEASQNSSTSENSTPKKQEQQTQGCTRKLRSRAVDSKESTASPSKNNNSTSSRTLRSQSTSSNNAPSEPSELSMEVEKTATNKRKQKLPAKESIIRAFEVGQDIRVQLEENEMYNAIIKGVTVDDLYIVELDNGEIINDISIDNIMDIE